MSTITLPNIRVSSDLEIRLKLKDGGVAIDWTTLSNIKATIYSDRQRSLAGRCDIAIDEDDATILVCRYSANKPQYPGVNRVIVCCTYDGETKTYDKPAFTFVRWTDDQAGQAITIDDPDIDVEISVQDVSSSILQEAVEAAFSAADRADEAAAAAEHMVDIHTGPAGADGKSAYELAVEEGYTGTEEEWLASLHGTDGTDGTDGKSAYQIAVDEGFVGTEEQWLASLKGEQGNPGSSQDYPFELVNNEETNDATKAHTAAGAKRLNDKIGQLEAKTGNPLSEYKDIGLPTAGFYDLSGATISARQSADRTYSIRKTAKQGDKFKISGNSGTTAILWGFIDGGGNILSKADENTDYRQNPAEITAPSGTEEIIINFNLFSPITDWAKEYVVLSLTEQVETKTNTEFSLEGQTLSSGYYTLSSSTLPTTRTSSVNYKSIMLEGKPGDMFQIVGVSSTSTNARLWATGDASRNRIRYASTNQDARTNSATITLETGEKYLYVNLYLPTTGDGVSIIKSTTKNTDLITRVDDLEATSARRILSKRSFPCMLGALRYTNGMYAAYTQYLLGYSHTPKFIKNHGWFRVNYSGQFGICFYDSDQNFIGYYLEEEGGPVTFERKDFAFFRVWTRTEEVHSIEIESYWTGDDEVFQKLPTDEGYQPMAFGVNINKGFIPNDTGDSAVTTGYVKSSNYGMLHLPASYKEVGTPTPLIIYLHGAADRYEITSTRFASMVRYSPEWDSMGFAQMDVDMVPDVYNTGDSTNVQCGTGDDAACVEAAYNWAIQHFNIRRDGVYLFGRSRGGEAVLEILSKFNPSKLPVVCALSNAGANAMLLYSLFRNGNSTFWRIFCESTGLDALNPPAYSSGLIIANSTIAQFLRTNIDIWWKKAMVALPMCVDNPTEYQTPTQIFDLLVASYTSADPGKTFIEDFIERCKFRSPVPLRFDWCAGDTIQPWEATSYGNYGSAGKNGFVNNKLAGNSIYRRWPSCPEGDEPHYHELYNLADYTLPNGETIQNASMAMVEWLLWAMGQDERFTI